ncbi:MAG: hypothetical protein WB952_07905 [Terriglobales bacterium]
MSFLYKEVRRILLIDADLRKRNLRTAVFRGHEFEVHTAASLTEAVPLWKTILYDLILMADPEHTGCAAWIKEIRDDRPSQRIGLLVGPPSYIQEVTRIPAKTKLARAKRAVSTPLTPVEVPAANQWQKTIYALLNDWRTTQAAVFKLRQATVPARPNTV